MLCCKGDTDLPNSEIVKDKKQQQLVAKDNLNNNSEESKIQQGNFAKENQIVQLVQSRIGDYNEDQIIKSLDEFSSVRKDIDADFKVSENQSKKQSFHNSVFLGQQTMGKSTGTRVFNDGTIHEGNYLDCNLNGIGRLISNDGNVYKGEFKENTASGTGELHGFSGDVYKGHFENSKAHGKGSYTNNYGIIYVGDFVNGTFHGKGNLTVPGKYIYTGEFMHGNFNGDGEIEWIDNTDRIFKGKFQGGKFHGMDCYYRDEKGNTYEGQYCYGVKESMWQTDPEDGVTCLNEGVYTVHRLKASYTCGWCEGKMHGNLVIKDITKNNAVIFEGYIEDDKIIDPSKKKKQFEKHDPDVLPPNAGFLLKQIEDLADNIDKFNYKKVVVGDIDGKVAGDVKIGTNYGTFDPNSQFNYSNVEVKNISANVEGDLCIG